MVKKRVEIEKNLETLSFLNYGKLQEDAYKPRAKKKSGSVHPIERKDTRTFSEVLFPRQSNPDRSVMTNFKPVRSSSNERNPFVIQRALKINLFLVAKGRMQENTRRVLPGPARARFICKVAK